MYRTTSAVARIERERAHFRAAAMLATRELAAQLANPFRGVSDDRLVAEVLRRGMVASSPVDRKH